MLLLLFTALAILVAQLLADAPVIQTRVGVSAMCKPLMYGGIGGEGGAAVNSGSS